MEETPDGGEVKTALMLELVNVTELRSDEGYTLSEGITELLDMAVGYVDIESVLELDETAEMLDGVLYALEAGPVVPGKVVG